MSLSPFSQSNPSQITSTIAMAPVYNVLTSMALLTSPNLDKEKEPWLAAVTARLTAERRRRNRILFEGLGAAILPDKEYDNFSAYVDALTAESPKILRDRVGPDISPQLDDSLIQEAQRLLNDPQAMQHFITSHLRSLWEAEFSAEWQKKQPNMRFALTLNDRSWPTESPSALIRTFLRRDIPDWLHTQLAEVQHIIFVPSPYIHLHAACFGHPTTLWLFLWADPWTWPMRSEPIQRSEILGPASALADYTRLCILELLAVHEELSAQEIIAHLEVSQSTVSRHLKQLSRANFISERRAGDANKLYRLQRERVGQFAYTLSQLLSAENARLVLTDVRLDQPAALRPFLNRDGLVINWPAKRKAQQAVLEYLITKFTLDERYLEAEVNGLLKQWHTYNDPAYLRRSLVDARLLKRTPDGGQYWRVQ